VLIETLDLKNATPVGHSTRGTKSHTAVDRFILLIASIAVGSHVLSFFGISLPAIQVGGGLIMIATG
jgi:small neutral amino acid transporter SnatA (MarC family)